LTSALVTCVCAALPWSSSATAVILADFPYLEAEDIVAALEFAAAQADRAVLRIG